MNAYLWAMALGTAVIFGLYGLRCARGPELLRPKAWTAALLSLGLAVVFGVVLSRISYALLMQELDFEYDGIYALEYLLEFEIDNVSFFGGALGVCLGVWLANRLTRGKDAILGLDAFAPFGALLVALFRVGEMAFGSYGTGTSLPENSPFAFFPVALEIQVDGGYSYWGWAIFMLSAAFALIWAGVAFFGLKGRGRRGFTFTLSLFFLCLFQVLCESMRKRGMFWLFVHVEQLLCALVLAGVLIYWILNTKAPGGLRRWTPMLGTLVCVGLVVAAEFAIDGKLFDLPHSVCYLFMIAVLSGIGFCGGLAAKRWNRQN